MGQSSDEIEKEVLASQEKRRLILETKPIVSSGQVFDTHLYQADTKDGYESSIPLDLEINDVVEDMSMTDPSKYLKELERAGATDNPMLIYKKKTIADRETEYQAKRHNRVLSPCRQDPFLGDGVTPCRSDSINQARTYADVMKDVNLKNQRTDLIREVRDKSKSGELKIKHEEISESGQRKRKIDLVIKSENVGTSYNESIQMDTPCADNRSWDITPTINKDQKENVIINDTKEKLIDPPVLYLNRDQQMAETPRIIHESKFSETNIKIETPSRRQSRWHEAPTLKRETIEKSDRKFAPTNLVSTSSGASVRLEGVNIAKTPISRGAVGMQTPTLGSSNIPLTPEKMQQLKWEKEIDERNRPWTDEDLNILFPFDGYKILAPPQGYQPIRTPLRRTTAPATPVPGTPSLSAAAAYNIPGVCEGVSSMPSLLPPAGDLPALKQEDIQYFDKLLTEVDESTLTLDERKERTIMKLLLRIKNGTPQMRKASLRTITDKARDFGAGNLFDQILPILMSPTLEDQERHLLVKVIDRILYKLDDLVRPYVHKILVVIEPLLIDEDYYARVEGREIISNLAKAAGLATMISTMRPDIDDNDEYVRNTTARAFAVVASALGIPALLPFLKAVCKSKKSWQARHTGIKIVQQIAILMGCAILPHLRSLVEIIEHGLEDEQQKVRTITALGIAALAEAATPYGIESFDSVLKPLWKGIRQHRGKGLAAFLKSIGYLIPLMDSDYAFHYTKEVVIILVREFPSPDEEMKKIVLKVIKQCCSTDGVEAPYIKSEILPEYFKHFWNHRMAMDKRHFAQLIDTTVEISQKVGASYIVSKVVDGLKDDNENYRKMVMETIDYILTSHGATDIDTKLEEQLIDGALYAFQEQHIDEVVVLNGFGTIVNSLGLRTKPYIPQICGTILWRLNNRSTKVREQAADLIARIAPVMKLCEEDKLLSHFGIVLYEYLGEEFPDVLGSILGALKAVVSVIGMNKMTPPIKDLLPRLTPILKNRHEKVQENCIDLVGRIADRGAEHVSAREWMRICFELLELVKAHKKSIRRAAVNTFGYIAKAIGPQDVMATLLSNLKVQERQNRICTTVAIAIVAETCSPFTILPALMNEYRVPDYNVQNGVLKSLSFLFEYIGEMAKDYIFSVTPLFEDALIDRDIVHRQISCATIKHMALGVVGFSHEECLTHLLNLIWPNLYETTPHMVNAVMEAIEGLRVALGPCRILQYTLQGLFHPARRVRDVYWRIYNSVYIASQDALVAFYPTVSNEGHNTYVRNELLYFL